MGEHETAEDERRAPRLLVADNNPFLQKLLRGVLEADGHTVRVARDGLAPTTGASPRTL